MLYIYNNDATVSRIQVAPEFFHSVTLGSGNHKRVMTYREKSESVAHHLTTTFNGSSTYTGHTLMRGDEQLIKVGIQVEKPAPPTKDWNRILVKDAKRQFKKEIECKYAFELAHGYSLGKVWSNHASKGVLASSTTQLL